LEDDGDMANHIKYPVVNGQKKCGLCGRMKHLSEYAKARKYWAYACIDCRRLYAAQYRQRPEVKAAQLSYSRKYRAIPKNRRRLNENTRRSRRRPEAKIKRNIVRKAWTAREKQKAIQYKGGACFCCGYTACSAAMDFHHLVPSLKEHFSTGALVAHWTFERNRKELDKCVLLCVRCHREVHAGARTL
jgi:hypothetical protein